MSKLAEQLKLRPTNFRQAPLGDLVAVEWDTSQDKLTFSTQYKLSATIQEFITLPPDPEAELILEAKNLLVKRIVYQMFGEFKDDIYDIRKAALEQDYRAVMNAVNNLQTKMFST